MSYLISPQRHHASTSGFSLIELMIVMGLMSVFLFGLVTFYLDSRKNQYAVDNIARLQETGRTAIKLVTADLRRSGYFGGNSDLATVTGSVGKVSAETTCPALDTTWGRMIEQPRFGLNDTSNGYTCISGAEYLRGDVLVLRFASPWWVASGDMDTNRLYIRSSLYEGKIFRGAEEGDSENVVADATAQSHELLARAYYVGPTGRTCNGDAVPALFRMSLGDDGTPMSEELIAGVEHFQVQYKVANRYLNANAVSDWDEIEAVKIWLLARSQCAESNFENEEVFAMGDLAADYGPGDGFRRELFTAVMALRN